VVQEDATFVFEITLVQC